MTRALVFLALFCAGCVGRILSGGTLLLVHPDSGERIACRGRGYHPALDGIQARDCAKQYEALGFVRAENLTPAQKTIAAKPPTQHIEQDITIRVP